MARQRSTSGKRVGSNGGLEVVGATLRGKLGVGAEGERKTQMEAAKVGRLHFLDWLDFEDEFQKNFMLLDSEAAAINVLETTAYFQGKRTVDSYLDQCQDLIYDSGYTDPKTVVVKFRRGLDCRISIALTGMAFGRPLDTVRETRTATWGEGMMKDEGVRRSPSLG